MELFNFFLNILPGGVTCLFGLKIRRIVVVLSWFVIGYFISSFFLEHMAMSSILKYIIQISIGLVFALFSFKLQKASWFLLLFAMGFMGINLVLPSTWYFIILALIGGLALGILGIYLYEPMIVFTTSLSGAYSVSVATAKYFSLNKIIYVLFFILLAVAGLYVQFKGLKKLKESE